MAQSCGCTHNACDSSVIGYNHQLLCDSVSIFDWLLARHDYLAALHGKGSYCDCPDCHEKCQACPEGMNPYCNRIDSIGCYIFAFISVNSCFNLSMSVLVAGQPMPSPSCSFGLGIYWGQGPESSTFFERLNRHIPCENVPSRLESTSHLAQAMRTE